MTLICGVFALVLVAAPHVIYATPGAQQIVFSPGQKTARIKGRFTRNKQEAYFSLRGRAGQHLRVKIEPIGRDLVTAGVVISPSGKQDGGPGGVVFDSDLTETGVYRIRVTQRQAHVTGTFWVQVEIS